ncbi:nitronate monooxygenase [Fictibacillus sp. WQ 8-8]|uniref:NAD(P)H-dependent flavin oxidoreductase n=1 Tax=unclassified Fictibacillus TaxID=2644029 RepID=UPI002108919A|nr:MULTISPECIES: nitronate monooxygenase [unclassified Fictibacillus]MCQ6265416.1 nitronate monooxygenase [Fictibacillus sp. WQ 8-8]MED2973683.1 nitronate monooxygenase [Fictibacillus sp. B-59209]
MKQSILSLFDIQYPIVQAGMAGGPATPELAAAVSNAGGLGTLGAGYMKPADLQAAIKTIRETTDKPYAVNLFLPEEFMEDRVQTEKMQALLAPFRSSLGMDKATGKKEHQSTFQEQLQCVLDAQVPIVSFTFNAPSDELVDLLKGHGVRIMATATSVKEAQKLEALGIDAISAQGSEAGGHRGTFIGEAEDALIGTMALIPLLTDAVSVPVIAAGGIMDGRGIAAAMALGASGVQLGTAFLASAESGAHPLHKDAVLHAKETDLRLTKAFSGKMARGINNDFMKQMAAVEDLPPYPILNAMTSEIRKKAASEGKRELMSLWAGQGAPLAESRPAREIMKRLLKEYNEVISQMKPF